MSRPVHASNDAPSVGLRCSFFELLLTRRLALLLFVFTGCQQSLFGATLRFPQNKMQWRLTVS